MVGCWLGKSGAISSVYPEQFELRLALLDGLKRDKIPSQQPTGNCYRKDRLVCEVPRYRESKELHQK